MSCIFCRLRGGFLGRRATHVVFGMSVCPSHADRLVDEIADGASVREILAKARARAW